MQKNEEENDTMPICSCCDNSSKEEKNSFWKKSILIMITGAVLLFTGFCVDFFTGQELLAEILFLAVVVVAGYEIVEEAIIGLMNKKFNMNLLMIIAAAGAFMIGHGEEGATVILLFFVAEFLEEYAGERARKSVASLLELAPKTAVVQRNSKNLEVHAHEVESGEIVVVKPGDKIPLDGMVFKGVSSVNQAPITGESFPVPKSEGNEVFAGTLNLEGYLEVKVTKKSDETILSRIVELVKESQKKKSHIEVFIDRFAGYYTPTVILLAVAVAIIPPFLLGLSFDEWFYRALVLLVVSCPCALVISTPVSMVSAITSSTKNGVLIKGAQYVEEMKNLEVMVFDKTGTLTEGKMEVTDIKPLNSYSEDEILQVAASLESRSKHPIAEPILRKAEDKNVDLKNVSKFKSIAGKGLKGVIDGETFYAGQKSLFRCEVPEDMIRELEESGKTGVLIGSENSIMGVVGLMDKIRDDAANTIKNLKSQGMKTVMLTGDNESTAKAVSSSIGIDRYYAGLLPENKLEILEDLMTDHKHVGMVGDGVNDAPALARASTGIAMGAVGSDVAIETADVALMHDDLSKLNYLFKLSDKTMSVVKQNTTVSILIKGSFAVLAVFGFITLWMAVGIGDMGLSLAVILNSLRIGNKDAVQV
jgi:Cd2+/Zn2+-exporting ATPase